MLNCSYHLPLGWAVLGLAWLGLAWLGLAWLGKAWQGLARLGLAWQGLAWLGLTWRDTGHGLENHIPFALKSVHSCFRLALQIVLLASRWE